MQTATLIDAADRDLHRVLRAIHHNVLLSKLQDTHDLAKADDCMLSSEQVYSQFNGYAELLYRSAALLDTCRLHFEIGPQYPHKNLSRYTGHEDLDYRLLCFLAHKGIPSRYGMLPPGLEDRLNKELSIIRQKRYVAYFLINWKILKHARASDFFYVGRGSGANSLVAYLLFITDVDPLELDLYFERFINLYRSNPPDFDLDFSWQDRDEVLRYVFRRFTNVALLGTHVCYRHRSAVRELCKAMGVPRDEADRLVAMRGGDQQPEDYLGRMIQDYARRMQDMPAHHSIHAGGVLITEQSVLNYTACFRPPKGFATAMMDMHDAEDMGFHKFDLLSQRGLAKIKDTLRGLGPVRQRALTQILRDTPRLKRNARVIQMLSQSASVGCFYIESPAMRMLLTKLRVRDYLGLVAASSVIRPGVSSSGMMRVYIERERCASKREEAPEALRDLLSETHGVMIYQEDVIRVAHFFGGLSLAESDVLRRSMSGKHRGLTELQQLEQNFLTKAMAQGHEASLVQELWRQIAGFAGYAFAKGHSASYAVESYQCLYLKAYAPLEYMVSVLNNGGGFYSTEEYLQEAVRLGARAEGPCVNRSGDSFVLEGKSVWVGLRWINGLEERSISHILESRRMDGAFVTVEDFCRRTGLGREQTLLLWRVGALRSLASSRISALWSVRLYYGGSSVSLVHAPGMSLFRETPLHPWGESRGMGSVPHAGIRQAYDEMELLGFTLSDPFVLVEQGTFGPPRSMSEHGGAVPSEVTLDLYAVHMRTVRTVRGERMAFGCWRDPLGAWVDTVHFPSQLTQYPWKGRGVYRITGMLLEEYDYRYVEVSSMCKRAYLSVESSFGSSSEDFAAEDFTSIIPLSL
jgi:DNA polymerase-3 subunit alpha